MSPDLNGDRELDLADIVAFTQALLSYTPCADFNHDDAVNLVDVVGMTRAIGVHCP